MKKTLFTLAILVTLLSGCENNFEEINTNKNAATEAKPANLLRGIIFETVHTPFAFDINTGNFMMQYMVNIDGGGQFDFRNGYWGTSYAVFGNIVELQKATNDDAALLGYEIVGKILKAYNAALLSELYIDVPYTEAGAGLTGNIFPVYDTQESILKSVISELEQANTMLNQNKTLTIPQGGDLIYNGNLSKWQKLANSLRLRYLLKISKAQATASAINQIVSNPTLNPIFENNGDDALFNYTGIIPYVSVFDGLTNSQFEILAASKFYVDLLKQSNDPRLDFFFSLPKNTSIKEHRGVPPGLSGAEFTTQFPQGGADMSLLNTRFFATKGLIDFAIMTNSELNFILSEVAFKGYTSGNAKVLYDKAILANISYWKLTATSDFLTKPGVVWNNTLERLITQKWVAGFNVFNFESWSDYKRVGLPVFNLPVNTFPATNGKIPTRMIYPVSEQSVNNANYTAAAQKIGGDNSLAKHWYQGN